MPTIYVNHTDVSNMTQLSLTISYSPETKPETAKVSNEKANEGEM